ncbi:MAG: DUF2784 domain-containing protein [Actinomycetota bacterium]|nr:DUF2784 domain-containing protein [Actinomycetota bacterium]
MDTLWRRLADGVAGVHYAYMAYMLVGGFIAWRWPKTIWAHRVAVLWAALIVTTKVPCPLTAMQNRLRESAGQRPLSDSFINLYIRGTFYPADEQTVARAATAAAVIASWVGFARLQHRKHPEPQRVDSAHL